MWRRQRVGGDVLGEGLACLPLPPFPFRERFGLDDRFAGLAQMAFPNGHADLGATLALNGVGERTAGGEGLALAVRQRPDRGMLSAYRQLPAASKE